MQIPITPLVIQVPVMFPFESGQAIPWRYEPKVYRKGQENQPLIINEPDVTTIAGLGGMTLSGWVFSPRNVEPLAKAKEKEIASNTQNSAQNVESP